MLCGPKCLWTAWNEIGVEDGRCRIILEVTDYKKNHADKVSSPYRSATLHCSGKNNSSSKKKKIEKLNKWKAVNRAQKQTATKSKQNKPKQNPRELCTKTYHYVCPGEEEGDRTPFSSLVNAAGYWQLFMTHPQVHTLKLTACQLEKLCKGEYKKCTRKEILSHFNFIIKDFQY